MPPPRGFSSWTAYRDDLARKKGWRTYAQQRWWDKRWTPEVEAAISANCWARHATAEDFEFRTGSLWPLHCNDIVNARTNTPRGAGNPRPGTYQIRVIRHYVEDERRGDRGRFVRGTTRKARRTRIERAGVPVAALAGRMEA